jgi:DNA polymerase-4
MMHNLLGKNGIELHRRANGIDESPVIPFRDKNQLAQNKLLIATLLTSTFYTSNLSA